MMNNATPKAFLLYLFFACGEKVREERLFCVVYTACGCCDTNQSGSQTEGSQPHQRANKEQGASDEPNHRP